MRNVTVEGDDRTYFCEVRTLPGQGLRVRSHCWIEFGVKWIEHDGGKHKVAGQWQPCVILDGPAGTSADVHVRIALRQPALLDPSAIDEKKNR